jgi:hypothetical protein
MYCPDTYKRINDEKVAEYQAQLKAEADVRQEWEDKNEDEVAPDSTVCEFCDKEPATQVIPVYNPADKINGRVQDAYAVYHICDRCVDEGAHMEQNFYCEKCGEFFIYNHSWEVLAVVKDNGMYCQSCAAEDAVDQGVFAFNFLETLQLEDEDKIRKMFIKLDNMPGMRLLCEVEFSQYSDFPGCTSFRQVADAVQDAMDEAGLDEDEIIYPLVTSGRQFSVTLAVYY